MATTRPSRCGCLGFAQPRSDCLLEVTDRATTQEQKKEAEGWRVLHAFAKVLALAPLRKRIVVIGGLFISSIFEAARPDDDHSAPGGRLDGAPLEQARDQLRHPIRYGVVGLPFDPTIILLLIVIGLSLKALITISVMSYTSATSSPTSATIIKSVCCAISCVPNGASSYASPWGACARHRSEAGAVGESFMSASTIVANSLQACLFLTVAALISWKLAALALVVGFLMFPSFGKAVTRSRSAARQHRTQMRQLAANFTDAMIGIKPIRAMGRTDRFSRLFEADARSIADSLRTRVVSSEYVSEMQEPVIGCLLAIGFYYATQSSSLNMIDVIICVLLVRTISILGPLQKTFQRFMQSFDQYQSLQHLLREG